MDNNDIFILQVYGQWHGCWWPGDARSQDIYSHGIDPEYSILNTRGVNDCIQLVHISTERILVEWAFVQIIHISIYITA